MKGDDYVIGTGVASSMREETNIISVICKDNGIERKEKVKYNLDGSIKRTHTNRVAGQSSEVYAFRSQEEIESMIAVFDSRIGCAQSDHQRQIARRNKMLFVIGTNIGLRAGDLCNLKWRDIFESGGVFRRSCKLKPEKQRNKNKFVKIYFNEAIQEIVKEYVEYYPIEKMDQYIFCSRKGGHAISPPTLWRIIKEVAQEAGIEQNIGSHSLRKTFGYWAWHGAEDKEAALIRLSECFSHSSTAITKKYIGVTDEEIEDMFNGLNIRSKKNRGL